VRIAIALTQVPAAGERAFPRAALIAIEAALEVREQIGCEVVALAAGTRGAAVLRRAETMGADRTLLVSDGDMGDDRVGTSRVLAAALLRESAELIVFGQMPSDASDAIVPAAVARRLGLPLVSRAVALEVDPEAARVRAVRRTEVEDATLEAPLPAVVAITAPAHRPRYPSLYRLRDTASTRPTETSIAELDVAPGEPAAIVRQRRPLDTRQRLDTDAEPARRIVEFLAARGLL
jgi:electron transfer flavoprotein beta subunit